jgi:polysaccharide biosynthesis/export protein
VKTPGKVIVGFCLILCLEQALRAQQLPASLGATDKVTSSLGRSETTSARSVVPEPDYKIGAQDVLRIDVWKEDQLTRTVPVRPDGQVTLPLLDDVQAAGLTPMELSVAISNRLKKYVNNPQVTVTVTEINSRRIYVTGEVARSGAFPMLPNMTVLQAISTSGGFTQFARTKKIYVLRAENGKSTKLPFNYNDAIKGKRPQESIVLRPGDVIVVP